MATNAFIRTMDMFNRAAICYQQRFASPVFPTYTNSAQQILNSGREFLPKEVDLAEIVLV
jgi:hypothetical protein